MPACESVFFISGDYKQKQLCYMGLFLFIIKAMNRFLKQFLFGGLLILIIGFIIVWIYWDSIFVAPTCSDGIQKKEEQGIDCGQICGIDCELKYIKDLSYSNAHVFSVGDLASVYFDLDNPNQNYGLKNFKYTIEFFGFADKLLKTVEGESFIYPGQNKDSEGGSKKIVEAGLRVIGEIKTIRVTFSNVIWKPSSEFRSIKLENQDMNTVKENEFFMVSGTLKSLVSFEIPQIIINVFLYDKEGQILGVSKTQYSNFTPFEERRYKIPVKIDKALEAGVDYTASMAAIYPVY